MEDEHEQHSHDDDHDDEMLREPGEIDMNELYEALQGLTLLGEDHYLGMQALNVAIVDSFIMNLETTARGYRGADDGIDIEHAMFLNAQSQMWMFAAYELLRTWRQRCNEVVKWHANGGLKLKIEALEKEEDYIHVGRKSFAETLRKVQADPSVIQAIKDDLARTHVCFKQMEFLRVAMAKHEVSGSPKMMAYAPGYARIDRDTGSMSYQMSNGPMIYGEVTRRSFGEGMRAFKDAEVPTAENLKSYDEYLAFKPSDIPKF